MDFMPTVSVSSISFPLEANDHNVALCTCNAPLERTVCLTDGLNATVVTNFEDKDSFAVLKLMFAVGVPRSRQPEVVLKCCRRWAIAGWFAARHPLRQARALRTIST